MDERKDNRKIKEKENMAWEEGKKRKQKNEIYLREKKNESLNFPIKIKPHFFFFF